jgi:N-hydroxyarylamine O-acetyltransferase
MNAAIDLDAYFERIGYSGPRAPTLELLRAIHGRHTQTIPFENLNPLLRTPVRLDAQSLQQKMIAEGRGGYCFEQNLLFSHALRAIGFEVRWLAARVLTNAPTDSLPARTHMLLLVTVAHEPYIADVGFGGLTLTGPLRLEVDVEQATPHEPFRLVAEDDELVMQARFGGAWNPLYRFGLQEQLLADYEVTNWYLSNHPDSKFVTNLIAARPDPDRRYALRNTLFSIHHLSGQTERRLLDSAEAVKNALETAFRINLPDTPALMESVERIVARETVSAGSV